MEITLPEFGVCCLGNINLTKFITDPFTRNAKFNMDDYKRTVEIAVRFLDNVLDITDYPYEENRRRAQGERRIGLNGFSGLGDALAMMMMRYDSKTALQFVHTLGDILVNTAYEASSKLAQEKGVFEDFDPCIYESKFITDRLNHDVKECIKKHGLRNCAILTVPPVGTGSMLAGNISSGLEPIFDLQYNRKIKQVDGSLVESLMEDYAWGLYKQLSGWKDGNIIPEYFQTAKAISPKAHVDMQAAIQRYTDNSISKTCNLPSTYTKKEYADLLMYALKSGVKGFTTYLEGSRDCVLSSVNPNADKENHVTDQLPLPNNNVKSRDRVLDGRTYKIKNNTGNIYVTVNHNENKHLSEVFMFSSNENQELYAALGKTLSAVMKRTADIGFLVEDLRSIKASTEAGGYLTKEYGFVRSFPNHLSYILEEHIGYLSGNKVENSLSECPECGEISLKHEGGCASCLSCSYSKCG